MRPTADLPDDPRLPGLMAIRDRGLARAIPAMGLAQGGGGVALVLSAYHPGARATRDAGVGQRRFAVKTFADDPAPEAALYQGRGAAGLAGGCGARVPPLLAWEHDLRVLVIGWLEGPTAHDLVKQGQGRHAGELAAQWVRRTASLPVKLGLPFGAAGMMHETRAWVGPVGTADLSVGAAARALAEALARAEPQDDGAVGLVHGTLYARHILDAGEGPGVIDWHRFGQGPAELDAGMFLATLSRLRLLRPAHAGEALRAEQAFLEGTRDLLDERALAWHRAAALLQLTERLPTAGRGDWRERAHALLGEATRLAERAAQAETMTPRQRAAVRFRAPALELVLRALSTRPATREELDQIRALLREGHDRASRRPRAPGARGDSRVRPGRGDPRAGTRRPSGRAHAARLHARVARHVRGPGRRPSLRTQAVCRRPRARGGAVRGPGRGRPSGRGAGPGAAAPRSRPLATSPGHRVARGPDGAGAPQRPAGGARRRAGRVLAAVRRGAAGQGRAARGCGSHGLERRIPTDGQADRRADEADHAVGLDEVAPLLAGPGVDVLGQEAVPIAAGQHVLEQATRFLPPPECGERVDVPERAHEERVVRLPEIVGLDVAEDEVPSAQLALDGAPRAGEPGGG